MVKPFETVKQSKARWILGVLGAIIVSIISSAIWDLLKPSFGNLTNGLLNFISLGIDSYKNDTYALIATGLHEEASVELYSLVLYILAVGSISLSFYLNRSSNLVLQKLEKSISHNFPGIKLPKKDKPGEEIDMSSSEEVLTFYTDKRKSLKIVLRFFWALVLILIITSTLNRVRSSYVNRAITKYQQLRRITDVYSSEQTRLDFDSKFAMIKDDADYKLLRKELVNLARSKNIEPPSFDPW